MTEQEFTDLMKREHVAVEAEISRCEADLAKMPKLSRWASRDEKLQLNIAERQLVELKGCRDLLLEPMRTPNNFASVDEAIHIAWKEGALHAANEVISGRRGSTINGPNIMEKRASLQLVWWCEAARRLQRKRAELLPEFLQEAAFWDREQIQNEIRKREFERSDNTLLTNYVTLFTTDKFIIEDPYEEANMFLTELIAQLRHGGRDRGGEDRQVAAIVGEITAQIQTEIELMNKCEEMKKFYPAEQHTAIDRAFRKRIEGLREGS